MSTTFVTAIYSKLPDGSQGRWERYIYSLKSISQCGSSFVVFTSPEEYEDLARFVTENITNPSRVLVLPRDISKNQWNSTFSKMSKWYSSGGRSMDLVHSKICWLDEISEKNPFNTTHFFWIDAGLSFCGLFPKRFLRRTDHRDYSQHTDYSTFNADWVNRLENRTQDRIYVIGMSPKVILWAEPLNQKFYTDHYREFHIIGGLFGGSKKELLNWFDVEYNSTLDEVLRDYPLTKKLPVEELIFNVVVSNNFDRFDVDIFDTWYHEDHEPCFDVYKRGKPFYHLFL